MSHRLPSVLALLALSASSHGAVVINELLGSTTGNDTEFVELYNNGSAPVDISGWKLYFYDSDAGTAFGGLDGGSPFSVPAGVVLAPGQHYLFANGTFTTAFGVTADAALPENAIENGSYTAILKDASGVRQDAVFVRDTGPTDVANEAGVTITPSLTVGPDGSNLPAGFTRTPEGGAGFALLEFSPVPAPSATPQGLAAAPAASCTDPVTLISAVQGAGLTSPLLGQKAAVRGVVVGDFQGSGGMRGFFVQSLPGQQDGDPATSEGLFVFDPANGTALVPGDVVRVAGTVAEFNGRTELSSVTSVLKCGAAPLPAPAPVPFPPTAVNDLERYEGMRVQPVTADGGFTVAQNFFLGRYGQVTLAAPDDTGTAGRLYQPTELFRPASAGALALAAQNARRLLVLDDAFEVNALGDNPNPVPLLGPPPPIVVRAGDRVEGLIGILDQGRINASTPPALAYRLQPTAPPQLVVRNPRPAPPALPGRLRVASVNVLNYFTTIDQAGAACYGPDSNPRNNCRGADSATELTRQRDKLVAALRGLNADVVGLVELQNEFGSGAAIADLTAALNAAVGAGTYAWINPGVTHIGGDAIAVGILYKPAKVAPVGSPALLTSAVDPAFIDTLNRPTLAQTFAEIGTGERFTVAVNHLKSKGSDCNAVGDPDRGDGQGNCNGTRTSAAQALARWLASDPTSSGDEDFLILGDLNAYAQEDPLQALKAAGWREQVRRFGGDGSYSYVFDGQSGALDHALAGVALSGQVAGALAWHINADEPAVIDYDQNFNPAGYYAADAYRASDHDPLLVGLNLGPAVPLNGSALRDTLAGGPGYERITGFAGGDTLSGGGGVDLFTYTSPRDAGDVITDFEPGVDALDLRPLLDSLSIRGAAAGGYVQLAACGADTLVLFDADGSAGAGRPLPLLRLRGIAAAGLELADIALLR